MCSGEDSECGCQRNHLTRLGKITRTVGVNPTGFWGKGGEDLGANDTDPYWDRHPYNMLLHRHPQHSDQRVALEGCPGGAALLNNLNMHQLQADKPHELGHRPSPF